jgi:hypothetical protein
MAGSGMGGVQSLPFPRLGKIDRGTASFQRLGRRLQYANQFKALSAIRQGCCPLVYAIQKVLAFDF